MTIIGKNMKRHDDPWETLPQTDQMLNLGLKVVGTIVQLTRKSVGRHGAH